MHTNANTNASLAKESQLSEGLAPLFFDKLILGQTRQKIDLLLKHKEEWLKIASLLFTNNPERSVDFFERLTRIDPSLSDAKKTMAVLDILNEYSGHSFIHSKDVADILNRMKDFIDVNGFEILQNIDFENLSQDMERHDLGKLGMPNRILNPDHPIEYTEQDNMIKEAHPVLGHLILKSLGFSKDCQRLALTHHLRYETHDGKLQIIGYPRDAFFKYCEENGLKPELQSEDHLAAFVDVFTAAIEKIRPSDLSGLRKEQHTPKELCMGAFKYMDAGNFKDHYYQAGAGASLYSAFKNAVFDKIEDIVKEMNKRAEKRAGKRSKKETKAA